MANKSENLFLRLKTIRNDETILFSAITRRAMSIEERRFNSRISVFLLSFSQIHGFYRVFVRRNIPRAMQRQCFIGAVKHVGRGLRDIAPLVAVFK